MFVEKAEFFDFRNLSGAAGFGPGFNVLCGSNGQGKTNVLEAVHMVCHGRSFRPGRLSDQIRFGRSAARVNLYIHDVGITTRMSMFMSPPSRVLALGGKEDCTAAEAADVLRVVFFGPDDLSLVKGQPAQRREFLDRAIWIHHPPYADLMKQYLKLVKERNKVLRDLKMGKSYSVHMLPSIEEEWAKAGHLIVQLRHRYLREFILASQKVMRDHSNGRLELNIKYEGMSESRALSGEGTGAEWLLNELEAVRQNDGQLGVTSVGPHVDDLVLELNGRPARFFASQGEQRAVAVSLKLGQLALWVERFSIKPVLLLDDVSSELDAERTRLLFEAIRGWGIQTLLTTTCVPDVLLGDPAVRLLRVSGGRLEEGG